MFAQLLIVLAVITAPKSYGDVDATVVRVHDGDTVIVSIPGYPPVVREIEVRVFGIDCAEIRDVNPWKRAKAAEATALTARLCQPGKTIRLINIRRDKYFRLLAEVETDGKDLAGELLKAGLARRYTGEGPKPWAD